MRVSQDMPKLFQESRESGYRKEIASFAKPPPEKASSRMEMARAIRAAAQENMAYCTDLPELTKQMWRFMNAAENTQWDTQEMGRLHPLDAMKRMFWDKGILLELRHKDMPLGRILYAGDLAGVQTTLAALEVHFGMASLYLPEKDANGGPKLPPTIIIDGAELLENAVFRINLFRHCEPEPISSIVLNEQEKMVATRKIVKDRINAIVPSGRFSFERFVGTALEMINDPDDPVQIMQALPKILAMRFTGLTVAASYSKDNVEHTINLCNLIARSTLIAQLTFHSERERMIRVAQDPQSFEASQMGNQQLRDMMTEYLSWVADVAYGNPFLRIGDIQRANVMGEVTGTMVLFAQQGISHILGSLDLLARDIKERPAKYHELLTVKEERLREAAASLLDEAYLVHTGKDFFGNFPELRSAFETVLRTDFLTRENLPQIVRSWIEAHGPQC